jgi:CelD/BcsL family acetyltransferase involved in cellulose biosynthesis
MSLEFWRRLFMPFDPCPNSIEVNGLRTMCYSEWPLDDRKLVAAWEELQKSVPAATTFHSPVWQKAVIDTQAQEDRLRLLTIWKSEQLVAVLPLSIRDDGLLESLAPGVSDYLDPLVHPDHEEGVWPLILRLLAWMRSRKWKDATLHNIREDSPARTQLGGRHALLEGFSLEERIVERCPRIALPKSWDEYLASFDAHERKEIRRKINKAMTKGSARVVRCSADPAEIAATLPVAVSLMEQAPGDKGLAVKNTLRPLLESAAPALVAQGQLWLTTLHINDRPAACTLQFPHSTGPQLYNCGFDSALREWSPGVVLTAIVIRHAIESGAAFFDLLRGQEPYKYRLGAEDRPLSMITLRKS